MLSGSNQGSTVIVYLLQNGPFQGYSVVKTHYVRAFAASKAFYGKFPWIKLCKLAIKITTPLPNSTSGIFSDKTKQRVPST